MYATYEFYTDAYGGKVISDAKWPDYERRAAAYIDQLTFARLKGRGEIPHEVQLAVCAAAEADRAEQAALASISHKVQKVSTDGYSEDYYSPASITKQYADQRAREVGLYLPRSHPLRYAGV